MLIKCPSEYIIPGFNDYLKELHNNARSSYLLWKHSGKPRGDNTDMDMRTTRLQFKYALRQCRSDEEMNRVDALARSYAVPIVAKHWDRPPNIFGETSEYVPCGAIYWHRLANMCG